MEAYDDLEDLHSNMVLLKVNISLYSFNNLKVFTFQYGSIKGMRFTVLVN